MNDLKVSCTPFIFWNPCRNHLFKTCFYCVIRCQKRNTETDWWCFNGFRSAQSFHNCTTTSTGDSRVWSAFCIIYLLLYCLYHKAFVLVLWNNFSSFFWGCPRRSVKYKHRYSSVISENNVNVVSTQETLESDIVGPTDDMEKHKTDQNVASQESELAGKWTLLENKGQLLSTLKSCYFPLSNFLFALLSCLFFFLCFSIDA